MVACEKPLAVFPKRLKNCSVKTTQKTKSNVEKVCLKEELLDDLDEMNEDQMNLLKDIDLLQLAIMENNVENKFNSNYVNELGVTSTQKKNKEKL